MTAAPHGGFTDVCAYAPLVPEWLAAGAPADIEPYDDVDAEAVLRRAQSDARLVAGGR